MIQRRKKQNESQRNETGRRTGAARTAQSTIVASRLGCVCTRVNKEGERAEALLLALSASVRLRILVLP